MSNIYTQIKDIFIEDDNIDWFINLDKSVNCYNKILSALQKPLKLILFYGKPGSGKTFLLNKIAKDLSDRQDIFFFRHPFFSEKDFINAIYKKVFGENDLLVENFEGFLERYSLKFERADNILKQQKIVILDEAQLYPSDLIEKIRLMADSRYFKFLFTIHKTENEDVLAKDYFQTRIWESIELRNSDFYEIRLYVQKKLGKYSLDINFSESDYRLIYKFCDGNLRTLNRLMYKFFEICECYEANQPSYLAAENKNEKVLYMSAIATESINA